MTLAFRDREEFKRGRAGEQRVCAWLRQHGYYVIPSYDYSGEDGNKSPKLAGLKDAFVVPDLDVAKDGRRRWVEVKTKTAATFTILTQRNEHGIEARLFSDYTYVQGITGCEVSLAFYELSTGRLLIATIDALRPYIRTSRMNGRPMVYFPVDAFRCFRIGED